MIHPYNIADVQFKLGDPIGQEGRNSDVFKAIDLHLDAEIVMKRMEKTKLNLDNYFSEAQILYKSSHPYIAPIHYACQDENYIYLAMPFFKNGSIKSKMNERRLTCKEIIRYSIQFVTGLHNIHSKNLVHLDIKPDNILISDRDEAILADFGLSKNLDENGQAELSRHYITHLAPEVFTQAPGLKPIIDRQYDIYQAGVTIYRMVVGNEKFYAQRDELFAQGALKRSIASGDFPDRNAIPFHVPRTLKNIILKCLNPLPSERYQSAHELYNALSNISSPGCNWQYVEVADGASYTNVNEDGSSIILTLLDNRSCIAYTVNADGVQRRIVPMCKDRVTDQELYRFMMNK